MQNVTLTSGPTWNQPGGGSLSWTNTANWAASLSPGGSFTSATFPAMISGTNNTVSNATITLDGQQTVSQLTFANGTAAGNYTLAPGSGGTLTLSNSNNGAMLTNYAGSNTISAPVVFNDNVQAVIGNGSLLTISGSISDTGTHSLAVNPTATTGTLRLTNSAGFNGGATVYGGNLQLGSGSSGQDGVLTGAGGVNLASVSAGLVFDLYGSQTYAGAISGLGGVAKLGQGRLALAGNDTYGGGTTISAGTLAVVSGGSLGSGNLTIASGGVLERLRPRRGRLQLQRRRARRGPRQLLRHRHQRLDQSQQRHAQRRWLRQSGHVDRRQRQPKPQRRHAELRRRRPGRRAQRGVDARRQRFHRSAGTDEHRYVYALHLQQQQRFAQHGRSVRRRPQRHWPADLYLRHLRRHVCVHNGNRLGRATLQWTGSGNNAWTLNGPQNWYNTSGGSADFFYAYDNVTFSDSGSAQPNVNISSSVLPGSLAVSNTNVNYTFSGSGSIAGATLAGQERPRRVGDRQQQRLYGRNEPPGRIARRQRGLRAGHGHDLHQRRHAQRQRRQRAGHGRDLHERRHAPDGQPIGASASTPPLTISGGVLDLHGYNLTAGTLADSGGTILSSSAAATLTVNSAAAVTYAGLLANGAGTLGLTLGGTGVATLSGSNTYTGNTTISAGTLAIGGAGLSGRRQLCRHDRRQQRPAGQHQPQPNV